MAALSLPETPTAPGRLALLADAMPGEYLPSALQRIAFQAGMSPRELARTVFRPGTTSQHLKLSGNHLRDAPAEDIKRALGWDAGQVRSMTMKQYEGRILRFSSDNTITYSNLWTRASGTRFCPDCLRENPGVFLCQWRLAWVFACTRHRTVLRDACHECGATLPEPNIMSPVFADPGRCPSHQDDEYGKLPCNCLLSDTWTEAPLLPNSPILRVQTAILDAVEAGGAINLTHTLRSNAIALLNARAYDVISLLSDVPSTAVASLYDAPGKIGTSPPPESMAMAAVTAAAWRLFADPEPTVSHLIREVTFSRPVTSTPQHGGDGPGSAALLLSYWNDAIHPMAGRILRAIDEDLPYTQRIVWGTAVPEALETTWFVHRRQAKPQFRRPSTGDGSRTPFLPPLLWPSWAAPWDIGASGYPATLQRALASAVSLAHRRRGAELDEPRSIEGLGRQLRPAMLGSKERTTALIRQIGELAVYLDLQGGPIRYDRRLNLPWHELLVDDDWAVLADVAGELRGTGPKLLNVRRFMCMRLTGIGFADLQGDWRPRGREVAVFSAFVLGMTAQFQHAIDDYLAAFLEAAGQPGPVTWAPTRWRPEDAALARELNDIDLARVHDLLAQGERAVGRLAEMASRSENHVGWALLEWPHDNGIPINCHDWLTTGIRVAS